ncbi:Uncharacterized protein APZ42_032019 [Daphnia magna]|uniref:Uncharacterized protein n=1 Tax=Daphnia magna TaxID=35525 RepID=A0A164MCJ9_9CRUS|nr:Uncharacterized protein APZ42_032019 [Daphnia magna]
MTCTTHPLLTMSMQAKTLNLSDRNTLLGNRLVRTKLLNVSFLGQESPLSMNCKRRCFVCFFLTFWLQKPIALCLQLSCHMKLLVAGIYSFQYNDF